MSIFGIFKQIEKERAPQGPVEFIIVGLGNPGTKYENTRHNMGFMAIDTLAEKVGADIKKLRFKSLTAEATVGGKKVLLMKPTTFMNNSGEAIVEALNFYKLTTEKLLVLYDDISLDVGKMRIRTKGSAGGHNGIKSIIYLTGSDVFPRIKMGVGQKPNKDYDLADWVLGHFPKEQGEALEQVFANAAASAELIVNGKTTEAMNKYN
ncbi:MAG: aminoacyl-tRNA hydrolase [Ruminiclostridium sp.]